MNPGCNPIRDELILALSEGQEWSHAQSAHLQECGECGAFAERTRRGLEVLRGLPALEAPRELEGRVVATLHAGFREDRSVRHLQALPAVEAPAELETNLSASESLSEDLFARVQQELLHPERSIGSRLARVTPRLAVPDELELRVARDLRRAVQPSLPRSLRSISGFALAAAAAFVAWLAPWSETDASRRPDSLSFTVREVESSTELTPMARSLMSGVTGGSSEVRKF